MRNIVYISIYSFLLLGLALEMQAQCTLSATSSGGNASYTQVYVLVNSGTGIVIAQNTTGTFASVSAGTYHIHALNYDPSNAPSPLPTVGQNVSSVGTTTVGCYNSDFLTDYVIRTCSSCQQSNTICETDPLVVSSSGGNGTYTQLYVLVNTSNNLVEATNATGDFTGMVTAGTAYQVYALNYNPSDAPSPLPTVGQAVSMVGTTTAGCYNSDFLTDYVCYTITNCATSCVRDYNVCENEDIVASSSGHNASYTQVYVLADNAGNFVAQNTTGIFSTSGFTLGDTYHVHALNYNPSDAPSPLPTALSVGDPLSNISGGCYNNDFLTDYVCYTIGCPCTGKLVEYAPNQAVAGGMGVAYTNATAYCDDVSGWRYYYDPSEPNDLLFAIEHKPAGGNTNDFQATVTLGVNDYSSTTGYDEPSSGQDLANFEANFGMGRYWDVDLSSGSLNGHVNVRFFYPPAEYNVANTAAANWRTANESAAIGAGYSGLAQLTPYWFKTNDASTYAPAPDLDPTTVNSSNILVLNDDFVGTDALPIHNNRNYVQFDNQITGFSGGTAAFRVTPVNILDNNLVQFRGRKQESVNVLDWLLDSEEDIAYYVLERSKDAVEFEQLAKLDNSNKLNYQFVDELPFNNSYYRLRLVSLDGSVQHSNMINLSRTGLNEQSINIYPNPTQGNLTVEFDTDLELNANLRILDVLGRTLTQENIEMQVGKNKTVLDLNNLPSAVYIISIETVNQKFVKRITKSK